MKIRIITIISFFFSAFVFGQASFSSYDIVRFDTNGDGKLDDSERAAAIKIMQKENKLRESKRNPYSGNARFDTNGDGGIDINEAVDGLKVLAAENENSYSAQAATQKKFLEEIVAENKLMDAQRIGKTASSQLITNTPEKKIDLLKAISVEVSEAEAVAGKFLAFVERKNARAAERMSYKIRNGNSSGGRSLQYKVPKFFIQHEINKYKAYGAFLRRTLVSYSVGKTAPSLPDSQYVSLRYKLEFSEKSEEFITIVIKTDGDQAGTVVAYPFGAIYADK